MIVDQVTIGNVIVAGIAATVPIATTVVSFIMTGRKVRRENEADVDAKIAPVRQDVAAIVGKIEKHVPRSEIEQADRAIADAANQALREVGDLREKYARLDEQQRAADGKLSDLASIMKEQGRETKADFEKVQDCLREIIRKVG